MVARALLLSLALSVPAWAYDSSLTPEKMAEIQREQKKALDEVAKAHGNKKPGEMSSTERRALMQEQADAEQKVFKKYGIDAKEFTRRKATMSKEERAQTAAAEKALEKKEVEAKKKEEQTREPEEIPVQRGFSNQDPVEMDSVPQGDGAEH
jgi:hypothetical protein